MAISRFQSTFKVRTDMMDNITPNNTVQMNASVPAGEWKPAAWLPTIWQNEASKDFFVISSGKVVSLDASGRVVPAGLLKRLADGAHGDTIITYDASDVDAKVIDIRTGNPLLLADIGNINSAVFCQAVLDQGWVISALVPAGSTANCQTIGRQFISAPVGIAAYDVYVWAGDDAANLHFTNYQKQHLIQFFTDVQMRVAHVCEPAASDVFNNGIKVAGATLEALTRYSHLDLTDVMAYDWTSKLAGNTSRTPVLLETGANVAWSGRERNDISLLARAGDWYLDADAGRIFFFLTAGGAAVPDDANGAALTALKAFDYTATVSVNEKMMHLVGEAKPGDFVVFDVNSNFIVRDMATAEDNADAGEAAVEAALAAVRDQYEWTVGRVFAFQKEPRGLLERVRTGWNGSEFKADAQMPGSATKGFSDLITLSDETVADEIAIINVKIQ
jgi:hypothetical protein